MTADFQRGRFANPPNKDCAVSCEQKRLNAVDLPRLGWRDRELDRVAE